jgi:putative ABC transport system permease protein
VFDPPPQHLSFPWGYLLLVTGVVVGCVVAVAAGAVRATRRPSVEIIRDL